MLTRRPGMMAAIADGAGWAPPALGTSLLGWWDAERADLITQSAGAVSSWLDIVGGYDAVQATGAAQPTYGAASFNSRPGVSFDGVDDFLTATVPASFPLAAVGCEMWAIVDQLALDADVNVRSIFAYGGGTNAFARRIMRVRSSSVSRFQCSVGNGTITPASINISVGGNGRHVVRAQVSASAIQADVDAAAGPSTAVVPGTTASRLRIGANNSTTAAEFGQMVVSAIIVTTPLSADQVTQLYAYFNRRV